MTISFFSNFLNSHQLPFCKAIIDRIGEDNFRFVATERIAPDRVAMGFDDMNEIYPFVVKEFDGEVGKNEAMRLAIESDVMIIGSAPFDYAKSRLENNKLTFIYAERLFKKGRISLLYPPKARRVYNLYTKNKKKNCYLLCASAYSKEDAKFCGFPSNKCFKWGYFPEMKNNPSFELLAAKKTGLKRPGVSILWAGRLIGWKHPEVALFVAKHLKEDGREFSMNIIGDGPLRERLEEEIKRLGMSEQVKMLGAQNHEKVLDEMEKSDIFLFTSDRNEGWGAVLNESMNCGCAVIANEAIGSVPFLVKDGINGLTYNGSPVRLIEKTKYLIDNADKRLEISASAHNTICNEWNASVATANFFSLISSLNNGGESPINSGPCSKA